MQNKEQLMTLQEALLTLREECKRHKNCRFCPLRDIHNNCYVTVYHPNEYKLAKQPMNVPAVFIEQEKQEKKDG